MERGGFIRGLLVAILLLAIVGGAAYFGYNAGIMQGLVEGRSGVTPPVQIAPYPYYGMHPFGFGFGALGCIFPFLFFLLIFGVLRGFLGRGHWGHGMHHGHGDAEGRGVPPKFEEWHKRAHEPEVK